MSDLELKRAHTVLRKSLSKIPTVTEWASNMNYDRSVFCRKYRKKTGRKPKEVLAEFRLTKIVELLENTLMCYYEIADAVGFNNYKVFYTFCKQQSGYSPTELRERLRSGKTNLEEIIQNTRTNN